MRNRSSGAQPGLRPHPEHVPMVSAKRGVRCLLLLALCMLLPARITLAQQAADVPYVPTPQNVVDTMLEMALVHTNDYLIDLGSGDGRIVIAAATRSGARGMGGG